MMELLEFLKGLIEEIIDFWTKVPGVMVIFLIFPLKEHDKEIHHKAGVIGTLILTIVLETKCEFLNAAIIAGGIVMGIAIAKEVFYDLILKKGKFEAADIAVTLVGTAITCMWMFVVSLIREVILKGGFCG